MSDDLNFTDFDMSNLEPILQFYYCIHIAMLGIQIVNKLVSYDNASLNYNVD